MGPSKPLWFAGGIFLSGCVHGGPAAGGPEAVARAYALALAEGRVDDAWALSAPLDREQFGARYADANARKQRAEVIARAAEGQPSAPLALEVRPQGWRVIESPAPAVALADEEQARALVGQFLAAVAGGDFDAALGLLAAPWRARYTPARLKADFSGEPSAQARLARIRMALPGRWEVTLAGPQLPLGEGKMLRLLREGGALKVAALE